MTENITDNKYTIGEKDTRPWGSWEVLSARPGYVVKEIMVLPQKQLSLQWHHHRGEHWVILEGEGEVTLDDKTIPVKTGSTVYLPKTSVHRMTNSGEHSIRFIEIQVGDILDENDIERIEDDYGRV